MRRDSPWGKARGAAALLALLVAISGPAGAHGPHAGDDVKAAFVLNFAKYVEWPAGEPGREDAPLVIGTYCAPAFDAVLADAVRGRTLRNRAIEMRAVRYTSQLRNVQLFYVCAEEEQAALALLHQLQGAPVVTVGETEWFAQQGGMIMLLLEQQKLRFDINVAPARRSGLRFSAQLQKLARRVTGGGQEATP